jgi:rubrerythrin
MTNLNESISIALEMEKEGYDHYINVARHTRNELAKKTLEAIAAKEIDHMKAIEKFATDVQAAIQMIHPQDKKEYLKPIMDQLQGRLQKEVQVDTDLTKAYEVAMTLEQASAALYTKLAAQTNDPQSKQFFEFLTKEENIHFELLQDTLQYLNHPADWFRYEEKWIVEGG